MKIEDIAYYIINESIQLANANQDYNYLMDYKKMLYMLFLVECEYMKQTNTSLFVEDFFLSTNDVAIGVEKGRTFDISLSKFLEQRLFIFEDVQYNKYTHPTFEMQFDAFTKKVINKVLMEYGFISINLLREMLVETFNLKGVYNYTLIEKEKMKSLFGVDTPTNNGISRIRELKD